MLLALSGTSLISLNMVIVLTEYCNTNMTAFTEYYPQLKSQRANEKYINDFLRQFKTTEVFGGYEYLNSVWLR